MWVQEDGCRRSPHCYHSFSKKQKGQKNLLQNSLLRTLLQMRNYKFPALLSLVLHTSSTLENERFTFFVTYFVWNSLLNSLISPFLLSECSGAGPVWPRGTRPLRWDTSLWLKGCRGWAPSAQLYTSAVCTRIFHGGIWHTQRDSSCCIYCSVWDNTCRQTRV